MTEIIELAHECIGTPFKHQGRKVGVGLDCAGVLVHILNGLGLPYHDDKGYPRRPFDGMLEKILHAEPSLVQIPKPEKQPGDLLVCRIKKAPQHLMIYTGETVIHAYSDTGRVVEQSATAWLPTVTHVFRIVK